MPIVELRPRLWRWTARHPDWTPAEGADEGWEPDVGCYAYVAPDGGTFVLFDPLVPADDTEGFWRALDDDVAHHGPPVVLLTIFWHARSSQQILDRYEGARLLAYEPAREEIEKRTAVSDVFQLGDELPAGIAVHAAGGTGLEVAYRVSEYDALIVGDSMIARPNEPARVWPSDESVRSALRALLEPQPELLLLTHGEPVLDNGSAALARALEA